MNITRWSFLAFFTRHNILKKHVSHHRRPNSPLLRLSPRMTLTRHEATKDLFFERGQLEVSRPDPDVSLASFSSYRTTLHSEANDDKYEKCDF